MDISLTYPKTANIDAIEAQKRIAARIGSSRPTTLILEGIGYAKGSNQLPAGLITPVIKIASNYQRRCGWDQTIHTCGKGRHLASSSRFKQAKVHTKAVKVYGVDCHLAMKKAALLEAVV